jgi:hypothetical protein
MARLSIRALMTERLVTMLSSEQIAARVMELGRQELTGRLVRHVRIDGVHVQEEGLVLGPRVEPLEHVGDHVLRRASATLADVVAVRAPALLEAEFVRDVAVGDERAGVVAVRGQQLG